MFGVEGDGFQRINAACPRPLLEQALNGLAKAF
jgi:bifunctional pyridoxal-dependent enzyme with beta-cystathionase and maltose regulon repressor activities